MGLNSFFWLFYHFTRLFVRTHTTTLYSTIFLLLWCCLFLIYLLSFFVIFKKILVALFHFNYFVLDRKTHFLPTCFPTRLPTSFFPPEFVGQISLLPFLPHDPAFFASIFRYCATKSDFCHPSLTTLFMLKMDAHRT